MEIQLAKNELGTLAGLLYELHGVGLEPIVRLEGDMWRITF